MQSLDYIDTSVCRQRRAQGQGFAVGSAQLSATYYRTMQAIDYKLIPVFFVSVEHRVDLFYRTILGLTSILFVFNLFRHFSITLFGFNLFGFDLYCSGILFGRKSLILKECSICSYCSCVLTHHVYKFLKPVLAEPKRRLHSFSFLKPIYFFLKNKSNNTNIFAKSTTYEKNNTPLKTNNRTIYYLII